MQCSNIQEQKLYIPWIAVFLWYQKEYVDFDIYFSFNFRITKVIPEMRKKKQLNCMSSWVTKNRRIKSEKNCLIKKAKMGEKGNFCCIASVAYRHPEIYLLFIRTFHFHLIFFRFFFASFTLCCFSLRLINTNGTRNSNPVFFIFMRQCVNAWWRWKFLSYHLKYFFVITYVNTFCLVVLDLVQLVSLLNAIATIYFLCYKFISWCLHCHLLPKYGTPYFLNE